MPKKSAAAAKPEEVTIEGIFGAGGRRARLASEEHAARNTTAANHSRRIAVGAKVTS